MAAMSGVASGLFKASDIHNAFQVYGEGSPGHGRYGFVVIDLGGEQGAAPGRGITISRDGIVFATGRVDRPYPTTSVAIIHNKEMLSAVRLGDTVSFS